MFDFGSPNFGTRSSQPFPLRNKAIVTPEKQSNKGGLSWAKTMRSVFCNRCRFKKQGRLGGSVLNSDDCIPGRTDEKSNLDVTPAKS